MTFLNIHIATGACQDTRFQRLMRTRAINKQGYKCNFKNVNVFVPIVELAAGLLEIQDTNSAQPAAAVAHRAAQNAMNTQNIVARMGITAVQPMAHPDAHGVPAAKPAVWAQGISTATAMPEQRL